MFEQGQQAPCIDHVHQKFWNRGTSQALAVGANDPRLVAFKAHTHALALFNLAGLWAGLEQQAQVEGIAEIQAAVRRRDHRRQTQVPQHACGLFA